MTEDDDFTPPPETEPEGSLVPPPRVPPTAVATASPQPPPQRKPSGEHWPSRRSEFQRFVDRTLDVVDYLADELAEGIGLRRSQTAD
jgi:hypothetical protein